MTWDQTLALIATIVVAVIAGIMYGNRRFDDLHRPIDDLRSDVSARFAQVDARFAQVDARFAQIDARFGQVDGRFVGIETRLRDLQIDLNARIAEVRDELQDLRALVAEPLRSRTP